ncbi:helix-turn-helix transcriptional regulator [Roseovarius aestuariivivens]|uniref:helix-turn-helix transcriptional regulator n=1 Tax=Roseovarius aestuariivivens TaxID=1888910 RepID=UPI001080A9A4|nr:helix-turn-helix domain-containing protein [Roseovarius aestuariivivens]
MGNNEDRDFYTTQELACRWKLHRRTLQRWRYSGKGPRFRRLEGRVRYAASDIIAFEAEAFEQGDRLLTNSDDEVRS